MNIWLATGCAAGRSLVVAIVATLFGWLIARLVSGSPYRNERRCLWGVMIATLVTPAIVVGYTYAQSSLALVHTPVLIELKYIGILLARYTPVAAITLLLAPQPPVSDAANHAFRLLPVARQSLSMRIGMAVSGKGRNFLLASAVTFLLVMQEFEIASLMARPTWTVWIYDAQVGGMAVTTTLRFVAVPLAAELGLIFMLGLLLRRQALLKRLSEGDVAPVVRVSKWPRALGWLAAAGPLVVILLIPAFIVIRETFRGAGAFTRQNLLLGEIGASLLFAGCGGWLAWWAAKRLSDRLLAEPTRATAAGSIIAVLPGLLGSLVVGLVILRGITWIGVDAIQHSVLPLIIALMVLLLPVGMLLHLLVGVREPASAIHEAVLLKSSATGRLRAASRELCWRLQGRPQFLILLLLVFLGFFDLAASALLYPPSMMPVSLMLYNQMHYGHIPVLFGMLGFAVVAPLVVLVILAAVRQLVLRYLWF